MPFVPDQPRKSRFVPDAKSRGPDPFAGDALLSNDAMARLEAGESITPTPAPSPFRGVSNYLSGINEAAGALNRAPSAGFGGTLEALGTIATGAVSPIPGTIDALITGKKPEDAFSRYTYQPRSESGQAQLGLLSALAKPLTDSGADAALLPLAPQSQSVRVAPRAPKVKPDPVPTTKKLSEAAEEAYGLSESAGVVIRPESTQRAAGIFREVAEAENLGKLPPKLSEAVAVLDERIKAARPLTLKDADKVRQLIGDAMKSTDAADRRLAKIIQGRYDQYIETLAPQDILAGNTERGVAMLSQARELYRRRKNSEMIDAMERRAQRKGESTYTQAGTEHALRREFEKLADNDKKMRTLTPEQRTAVERVAAPGVAQTTLRNLGKFDPTSGGMAALVGTGTGGAIGGAIGGLAGGGLGTLALPALGFVAKRGATHMTTRNVDKAREALVGRGVPTSLANPSASAGGGNRANRPVTQIQADLRRVEQMEQIVPPGSPVRARINAEKVRLQKELSAVSF